MVALPFSALDNTILKSSYNQCIFEINAIGDHIRKKRIDSNLLQEDVAAIIGVTTDSITNWENKRTFPVMKHMPGIIKFLGYVPMKFDQETLGGKIRFYRNIHGLTLKQFGNLIDADASTVGEWEKNKTMPYQKRMKLLLQVLNGTLSKE